MPFTRGLDRYQKEFTLARRTKGSHLVTDEVLHHIRDGVSETKTGILHLFMKHTSAALTLNENCDPDVRTDMTMVMDHLVPQSLPFDHTDEGPDDSQSHHLSSLFSVSVHIPIKEGRLALGTWQGIYLLEFRDLPHSRKIVATIL